MAMAGMASEAAKAMAGKRWAGTTAETRSALGRARVARRWSKDRHDQQAAEPPAVNLAEALQVVRDAIASKPGGSFYATPFDRLAAWLTAE